MFNIKASRRPRVWEMAVHLDVAGDVFDNISFCAVPFPRDVLDEILD